MNYNLPNSSKNLLAAFTALIIANVIWGAASPVIKITLSYLPIFTFLFLRFLAVCIIMLPFVILELKKNPVHKNDFFNIILLGIFGQSSIFFVFAGLKYTTALDSAIIGIIVPILSIAAGHYFYKEKVSARVKTGIILATIGTAFIVFEPIFGSDHQSIEPKLRILGNILVLLYSLAFLMYIIWSKISLGQISPTIKKTLSFIHIKPMKKRYSPLLLTALTFYVALASFIPFAIWEQVNLKNTAITSFNLFNYTITPILGVLYMAIFSSIVAYMAFEWGLTKASVSDTAIIGYMSPIFTLPFAYLMLGEIPTSITLMGSVIIAIGVVVAEKGKG